MIQPKKAPHMLTGTRIHPNETKHLCQRCGITITWDRHHYYGNTCHDCTPYTGATRKKRAA